MTDLPTPELHPIQLTPPIRYGATRGWLSKSVTMRAYEVYCAVYGSQEAMVTDGCRGGFGVGELIAFLYARSFPKDQWRARVDEALRGMKINGR